MRTIRKQIIHGNGDITEISLCAECGHPVNTYDYGSEVWNRRRNVN